jgi:hypothetical protein
MSELNKIKKRIEKIESRNHKVESDKAWETSWTRKLLLFTFTYLAIGLYMMAINIPQWWLNAIVPAVGFLLSTLTLPYFKKYWERRVYRK